MKVKKISIFLILFFFILILSNYSFAYTSFPANKIIANDTSGGSQKIGSVSLAILNIVKIVSLSVAVIMLMILAIKYISAAPNDKAEIKKHAVVYVVGALVMFSTGGILGIIQNFAEENIK